MGIIAILGITDMFAAFFFLIYRYIGFLPQSWVAFFAWILLIKGAIFSITGDVASIIDLFCAGIIFAGFVFTIPWQIVNVIFAYLLIKGFFSLF